MATRFSTRQIMNAALVSQGLDEIDDSQLLPEHRVLDRNWPAIVESELELGRHDFSKAEVALQSRVAGLFGFKDAYQLPGDVLFVRHLWVDETWGRNRDVPWVQDNQLVHLDSETGCSIEYVRVVDASFWSATFSRGIQMKLEACLLRSIKEEAGEAAQMEQMAEAKLQEARTLASQSRSATEPFRSNSVKRARFGGRHG